MRHNRKSVVQHLTMPIISPHVQRSKTKSSSTTPILEYNSNPNHCLNVKGYIGGLFTNWKQT